MYRALRAFGDVRVVAPETVQSATGHGVTLHYPLLTQKAALAGTDVVGIAVDGRPADCVKLALTHLTPGIDLVVSGINQGANVGVDVFYSGTVAAAVEGAFLGKPAIAVSHHLSERIKTSFDWAAKLALRVIAQLWERGEPRPGQVININIPALEEGKEPAGVKVVPQCVRPWPDEYERRLDPEGREYFWNRAKFTLARSEGDNDVVALREGHITLTPLHFDLTARERLDNLWRAIASEGTSGQGRSTR
jgi:5'-nucleotidase